MKTTSSCCIISLNFLLTLFDNGLFCGRETCNPDSASYSSTKYSLYTSDPKRSEMDCKSEDENTRVTPEYSRGDFGLSDSDDDEDQNERADAKIAPQKPAKDEPRNKKSRQSTLDSFVNQPDNKKRETRKTQRWNDADTENYRMGYPGLKDNHEENDNLRFYTGRMESYPDGAYIDTIHNDWYKNYQLLERHHGYIQWLFPIRENGMNWQAQALQLHEAEAIMKDKKAKERVVTSFKLMLDFYGMRLDEDKGEISISRSYKYKERYENLNRSSHNYLRITRILKSLGELGFEHFKKPFLVHILHEILEKKTLRNTFRSCRDYWIGTIKDDEDRAELYDRIENKP